MKKTSGEQKSKLNGFHDMFIHSALAKSTR